VFVAAAWMEYYSAKDKTLAIKIFELGLKRFSDKPEYVRQYMDFMSNMNDDNNTRVLYERVLTEDASGDKMETVWNKYLEFECNVGDLQSMQKVLYCRTQSGIYIGLIFIFCYFRLKAGGYYDFSVTKKQTKMEKKLNREKNQHYLLTGNINIISNIRIRLRFRFQISFPRFVSVHQGGITSNGIQG
jgi:hypothetical protein